MSIGETIDLLMTKKSLSKEKKILFEKILKLLRHQMQ